MNEINSRKIDDNETFYVNRISSENESNKFQTRLESTNSVERKQLF